VKKISLLLSCILLLSFCCSSGAEEIQFTEGTVADPWFDEAQRLAEDAIRADYPFDRALYDCTGYRNADESLLFEYSWCQSTEVIFSATVDLDGSIEVMYNDLYSLDNYYDELRLIYKGLFRNWPIEDKAWFASILPAHCTLENFRVLWKHPEWAAPEIHFSQPILMHHHGIPDEKAIPEKKALQLAKDALVQTAQADLEKLNACIISTYYYLDQPNQPQWVFQFWDKSQKINEVWIDAYTGEILSILQP